MVYSVFALSGGIDNDKATPILQVGTRSYNSKGGSSIICFLRLHPKFAIAKMLYAAYGSNLHPFRLQQRTPSAQLVGTGKIAHYTLRFHKRGYRDFSGKCNLIQQHDKTAYVAIYDIDKSEIPLLDRAEGAGAGYDRTFIPVDRFGDCMIYLATSDHIDDSLLPFSWYKALVIAGCEQLAFPSSYIMGIQAIAEMKDLECDRHDIHMKLIEQCRQAITTA